jgi:hypothetical protein
MSDDVAEPASDPDLDPDRFRGINVLRGAQLRLTGLKIDVETGEVEAGPVEIRVDVWPMWIEISAAQRNLATQARAENPGVDNPEFGESLRIEAKRAMTSIAASAFAMEAFAASVKHHRPDIAADVATDLADSTDGKIHQVWTRAAHFSNETSKSSRDGLSQIFRLRDQAVHPSAGWEEAVRHPDFPTGVERRFVMYRASNAVIASQFATSMIYHVASHPRGINPDWLAWCAVVVAEMEALSIAPRP